MMAEKISTVVVVFSDSRNTVISTARAAKIPTSNSRRFQRWESSPAANDPMILNSPIMEMAPAPT